VRELEAIDNVGAVKDEEAPGLAGRGFAGFGRFVVFERDLGAGDAVGGEGKRARRLEIGLFFGSGHAAVFGGGLGGVVEAAEGKLLCGERVLGACGGRG